MKLVTDARRAWMTYTVLVLFFVGFYASFHLVRSHFSTHPGILTFERVIASLMFADWILLALLSFTGLLIRARVGVIGLVTALFFY
jgi:hypothetical protein